MVNLLHAFATAWNLHDIDALMSMMTADCVFDASAGDAVNGERYEGQSAVRAAFASVFAQYPDAHWDGAQHFVIGNRGVSEWTFTGTRRDGRRVEVTGCAEPHRSLVAPITWSNPWTLAFPSRCLLPGSLKRSARYMKFFFPIVSALLGLHLAAPAAAAQGMRARDLGVPFDGVPGPLNAITDVPGVEVGHVTLIRGNGPLVKGEGPVRTGVTAILPRGRHFDPVYAAWYALNGNGEMTGLPWIEESGFLETPIMITNTFSVGVVRDAVVAWMDSTGYHAPGPIWYSYPVVAETYDVLNDILGQHVTRAHAFQALDAARPGPVVEGSVGGGTGMIAHEFKGGIGTASRLIASGHTLGVLVQANHGSRNRFSVAGVPVGREITDLQGNWEVLSRARGSIIVVVATDAPLLPTQLQRLAERVPIGIGRLGGLGENSSGDIFVAFSTGNPGAWGGGTDGIKVIPNAAMDALFAATVEATEEAILNAMVAAETMTGRDSLTVYALPHDRLQAGLRKYNRHVEPSSLPRPVALTKETIERVVGTYRLIEPGIERRIFLERGMLFLERGGGGRNRMLPITDRRFLLLGDGIVFDELPEEAGRPLRFRGTVNGEPFVTLERVRPDTP